MLRPVKNTRNFHFSTFDIESTDWINFYMLGFYDGRDYYHFDSVKEFLDHFLRKKYAAWRCFAHNFGKFDVNFILDSLIEDDRFKLIMFDQNGIGMLKVKRFNDYWIFLDSLKLLPASLDDLSKTFNIEHKKQSHIDRNRLQDYPKWQVAEYLKYDTIGLYEIIQAYQRMFSTVNAPLKSTTPSQAMSIWRQGIKNSIWTLPENVELFARRTYVGGRTEIYKMIFEKKFNYYDVNSLYPFVMLNSRIPCGKPIYVRSFKENNIGFYKATVKMPDIYIPNLPYRLNSKLLFPVGKTRGYFTSVELLRAIDLGADIDVDYGYVFGGDYLFREYVEKYYDIKKNAKNSVEKYIAKLMLNSLYGKFGQSREKNQIVKVSEFKDMLGLDPYKFEFGLFSQKTKSKANFIIPTISSQIAALARDHMFSLFKKVGLNNMIYSDTDSLLVKKKIPTGSDIGKLKLEMECKRGIFILPKLYILEKENGEFEIRAKGYEKFFRQGLTFDAFEKALHGNYEDFNMKTMKFAPFKQSMVRSNKALSMVEVSKSIKTKYSKREIMPDFDTEPLKITNR